MSEAAWKRRFRASMVMFPTWSRERPERLLYLSNAGGKFEVAWDQRTGERRHKQVAMEIAFVANHLGTTPPLA